MRLIVVRRSVLPVALAALAVVAASVGACGGDDGPTAGGARGDASTTTRAAGAGSTAGSGDGAAGGSAAVSFDGFGPVEVGMTLAEAEAAADVEVVPGELEAFGGWCFHATVAGLEERALLTVLPPTDEAPVDDPGDGVVLAVTVFDGLDDPATTDRGVGLGSTEAEVEEAYADHEIEVSGHHYVEGGRYLDVRDPRDPERLLRFETDGTTVTSFHGGHERAATLVEGCA